MKNTKTNTCLALNHLIGASTLKTTIEKIKNSKLRGLQLRIPHFIFVMDEGEGFKTLTKCMHSSFLSLGIFNEQGKDHFINNINTNTICYSEAENTALALTSMMQQKTVYSRNFSGIVALDINDLPLHASTSRKKELLTLISETCDHCIFVFRINRKNSESVKEYFSELRPCGNIEVIDIPVPDRADYTEFAQRFFGNRKIKIHPETLEKLMDKILPLVSNGILKSYSGMEKFLDDFVFNIASYRESFSESKIISKADIKYFNNNILPFKYELAEDNDKTIGFQV